MIRTGCARSGQHNAIRQKLISREVRSVEFSDQGSLAGLAVSQFVDESSFATQEALFAAAGVSHITLGLG